MPIDNLTEDQVQEFLDNSVLHSSLVIPVIAMKENARTHGPASLNGLEQRLYNRVIHDLEQVEALLNTITGRPIEQCALNHPQRGGDAYEIDRLVLYENFNVMEVKKLSRPDFYWRVAIRDSGEPDHLITGFYHGCSSGNLSDIREAFENTKHLFPARGGKLVTGAVQKPRLTMS